MFPTSRSQTLIIAFFLTVLVLFAATKVRMAESPRPGEELRVCQYDADSGAAIPHQFVLRSYDAAAYLLPPGRVVLKEPPTPFSPPYRGPPAQF